MSALGGELSDGLAEGPASAPGEGLSDGLAVGLISALGEVLTLWPGSGSLF